MLLITFDLNQTARTTFFLFFRLSIRYILSETDATQNIEPFLEIQLALELNYITFKPPLGIEEPGSFYSTYEDIMLDIMRMATLIERIDPIKATERDCYTVTS